MFNEKLSYLSQNAIYFIKGTARGESQWNDTGQFFGQNNFITQWACWHGNARGSCWSHFCTRWGIICSIYLFNVGIEKLGIKISFLFHRYSRNVVRNLMVIFNCFWEIFQALPATVNLLPKQGETFKTFFHRYCMLRIMTNFARKKIVIKVCISYQLNEFLVNTVSSHPFACR